MWVNTFKILTNTDAPEVVGNAYLFDTNFMVAEILEPYEDSDRSVIIKSGGQDGLLRWLEKNNYALEHKKIEQTTDLGKDVNIKLRMGLNEPITATLDDGSVVQTSGLQPWSINQPYSSMSLGKKIGQLTTSAFNEPWVMVVDGDIAAFMSMDSWKNPAYGITDYQGGGHNFWIPFMMSEDVGCRICYDNGFTTPTSPLSRRCYEGKWEGSRFNESICVWKLYLDHFLSFKIEWNGSPRDIMN